MLHLFSLSIIDSLLYAILHFFFFSDYHCIDAMITPFLFIIDDYFIFDYFF